jgi:hypothetical protein
MGKKKSVPEKAADIIICDLCGNPIKKGEPYFKHGSTSSHDKCHANVLKYGKVKP